MAPTFVHWTAPDGRVELAGQLDELGHSGLQHFTYAPSWLAGRAFDLGEGLPVQPAALLPPGGLSQFGLFQDAAPDDWGRRVISRRLTPRPRTDTEFLLAAADETRQGALRFSASPDGPFLADGGPEPIGTLEDLFAEVQEFQRDSTAKSTVARLMRAGTSQGGFRPKAAVSDEDGSLWIAKFPAETDRYDVETCEASALHVARDAGLDVPAFRLIRVDPDRAILLVKRFDRTLTGRLGYQSMRTAIRLGLNEGTDYQTMAATAGYLAGSRGRRAIVAAAVLNLTVHNVDDHSRNFGFLQDVRGRWSPAPVFDVVPYNQDQDGAPFAEGERQRSLEQLLDLDWGVPGREVAQIAAVVTAAAERVYEVAVKEYGLDAESAANAERVRARAQRPS